ncbi:hypothetical protein [Desulfobacter latus]|uniref:Uncharacterized protein n=1 Tax=Desulfobacter latus TaxID=2292 RepID=A0A850T9D7_9BACT|nr:hypothetical protein [Desulfobacter latus]NWH04807.1 hypothetical protein [Desulfobacter latus]
MNQGHKDILNFLKALNEVKKEDGKITLSAQVWEESSTDKAEANGSSARGFTNKPSQKTKTVESAPKDDIRENITPGDKQWHGRIKAGSTVSFSGISPITGFVHLFNLGTSGTCQKLAPSREFPDNRVAANQAFAIPSEKLFSPRYLGGSNGFKVSLNPDKTHIQPERLFVVVTRTDQVVQIEDLEPRLVTRQGCGDVLTRCASRGPGFGGSVETGRSNLLSHPEAWEYGLLEMEICE